MGSKLMSKADFIENNGCNTTSVTVKAPWLQ